MKIPHFLKKWNKTMNTFKILWLSLIVCLLLPLSAIGSDMGPFPGLLSEEVVILTGDDISSVLGHDISSFNLVAMRNGKPYAIPFQVDEIRNGETVYDWTSPAGIKEGLHTEDIDKGKFDSDDKVLFMAWDLSSRAEAETEFKAEKVIELKITDPTDAKNSAFAYLLVNSKILPNNIDYVDLNIANGYANVSTIRYKYKQPDTRGYFDTLKIRKPDGSWTKNVVVYNRVPSQIKLKLIPLKGEIDFYKMIRGETIGKRNGPIGAIWRCKGRADFGPFKIKGVGGMSARFYANTIALTVMMDIPFNFSMLVSRFDLYALLRLNPEILPIDYYNIELTDGIKLDGVPDGKNGILMGSMPSDWCVFSGWGSSIYFKLVFSDETPPNPDRTVYVNDGQKFTEAGLYLGNLAKLLTKGIHEYSYYFHVVPENYESGIEKKLSVISGQALEKESRIFQ